MKRAVFLMALNAMLLTGAGCARSPEAPEVPAAKKSLTRVSINLNASLTYAAIVIAKDEGYFADEGIELVPATLDANAGLAALVSGKLDVLSTGVRAGIFNMALRGVPIAIVADKSGAKPRACSAEALVAPPEMARRIAEKGTIRGERMVVVRGGIAEYLTDMLLRSHGLTEKDVTLVHLPQGAPVAASGELNAVRYAGEPTLSTMLREGTAQVVTTSEQLAPGRQTTVLVYGKRMLRDDPELGRRFMRAYVRGIRRYSEGKTERNLAILSRWTKLPPEVVRNTCWIGVANDGRIDPKNVQPFLDWALEKHYLDGPIATSQWWNPSFVDSVK